MPSFFGSGVEAAQNGERVLTCHWCGGWAWWPADADLTDATRAAGRVFCTKRGCEQRETETRLAAAQLEVLAAHDAECACPVCDPVGNADDGDASCEDRAQLAYERDHSAAVLG